MAAPPPTPSPFRIVGGRRELFRDGYHAFLDASWPTALGAIAVTWLGINAVFATGYSLVGGVTRLSPGDWRQAFYFSVQTLGTIGYGVMAPESDAANLLVVAESVVGLVVTAMATGLVFAKFGRTAPRVIFAHTAVIGPHDGLPTVTVRVGNERRNRIVGVHFKLTLVRTEHTTEGQTFYRFYDLPLVRPDTASLMAAFQVQHRIEAGSVLAGYDAARFVADEAELHMVVTGVDETTLQPLHAIHTYLPETISWNARYADMLTEQPDGTIEVDLRMFHETLTLPAPGN